MNRFVPGQRVKLARPSSPLELYLDSGVVGREFVVVQVSKLSSRVWITTPDIKGSAKTGGSWLVDSSALDLKEKR